MPVTASTSAVQVTAEKSTNTRPALRLVSTKNMPRETWLDVRRQGIGSSDAAAAVGYVPYRQLGEIAGREKRTRNAGDQLGDPASADACPVSYRPVCVTHS